MTDLRDEIAEAAYRVVIERNENWLPGLPATPWEQQTEYIHGLYRAIADSTLATDGVQRLIAKGDVTAVALPREDVDFIRKFHPDRDRTATRADLVRVIEHLQAALND